MLVLISIGLALGMAAALYRLFFRDFADFIECVRFWFQPDLISILRNEWQEDMWGTMKLGVWLTISVLMGFAAFSKLPDIFPQLASSERSIAYNSPRPRPYEPAPVAARTGVVNQTVPAQALEYDVKPGDVVELSALRPAIALRRATIVSMSTNDITLQSASDSYTIQWKDITRLRPAAKGAR